MFTPFICVVGVNKATCMYTVLRHIITYMTIYQEFPKKHRLTDMDEVTE